MRLCKGLHSIQHFASFFSCKKNSFFSLSQRALLVHAVANTKIECVANSEKQQQQYYYKKLLVDSFLV
jgi:hypothetical protein